MVRRGQAVGAAELAYEWSAEASYQEGAAQVVTPGTGALLMTAVRGRGDQRVRGAGRVVLAHRDLARCGITGLRAVFAVAPGSERSTSGQS
jgi:hypothetical protein